MTGNGKAATSGNGYHRTIVGKAKPGLNADRMDAIARALADPRRFAILQSIAANECTPCSVVREEHPISPATVSHHVKELQAAGLIELKREGRTMKMEFQREVWKQYLAQLAEI